VHQTSVTIETREIGRVLDYCKSIVAGWSAPSNVQVIESLYSESCGRTTETTHYINAVPWGFTGQRNNHIPSRRFLGDVRQKLATNLPTC